MNLDNKSVAYDLSLFERSKKKENNLIKMPKQKPKRNKSQLKLTITVFTMLLIIMVVSIVGVNIYGQVQLSELTSKVNASTKVLDESQNIYTQLKMKVASDLSLKSIEEKAISDLGMEKITPEQVEYINISDGDKAEVFQFVGGITIWHLLKQFFSGI